MNLNSQTDIEGKLLEGSNNLPQASVDPNDLNPKLKEILDILEQLSRDNPSGLPYVTKTDTSTDRAQFGWKIYKKAAGDLAQLLKDLTLEEFKKLREDPWFKSFIENAEIYGLIPKRLQDPNKLRQELIDALLNAEKGQIPDVIKRLQARFCKKLDSSSKKSEKPPQSQQSVVITTSLEQYQKKYTRSSQDIPPPHPNHVSSVNVKDLNTQPLSSQLELNVNQKEKKPEEENIYFLTPKQQALQSKINELPPDIAAKFTRPAVSSNFENDPNLSLLSHEIAIAGSGYNTSV